MQLLQWLTSLGSRFHVRNIGGDPWEDCTPYSICFQSGRCLFEPLLVPSCWVALWLGLRYFSHFRKLGRPMVAVSFLLFGIMMTDAMFVHAFASSPHTKPWFSPGTSFVLMIVDVSLTSCIAMSFFWNALVDLQWISPSSTRVVALQVVSYLSIFMAWIISLIDQWNLAFPILYTGLIAVCCGFWCIVQVIRICARRRRSRSTGSGWLFLAGASGAIGLAGTYMFAKQLCHLWDNLISADVVWFWLSDLSMYCIAQYELSSESADVDEALHGDPVHSINAQDVEQRVPLMKNVQPRAPFSRF